jgi:hypothetical protein
MENNNNNNNNNNSNMGIPHSYNYLNNVGANPYVLIVVVLVIIGYYVLFASLGESGSSSIGETSGTGMAYLEIILWGLFITLILLNGMSYIFTTNISASLKNIFSLTPEVDIVIDNSTGEGENIPVPEITYEKQVFHVPGNKYKYEDSKAICNAYGGRLATYKEIDNAYDDGADWCSFGWSAGQMALYPTQYNKWKKLQSIEGHKHDCGRPGINGGYIDNPNIQFGVNCYGYKPKMTQQEMEKMQNTSLYPKTMKEINFDEKVDYWRSKLQEIEVSPFNHNNWSVI